MNEVFKKRRSVRSFQKKEIEAEKLNEILQAIESAPSAGNLKAREVKIVQSGTMKEKLVQVAFGQNFISQAPVILVFFAVPSRSAVKYGQRGKDLYTLQDVTIAASFAWIQAVLIGLSACWVGAFDEEEIKKILKVDKDWRPIVLMPLGYSNKNK